MAVPITVIDELRSAGNIYYVSLAARNFQTRPRCGRSVDRLRSRQAPSLHARSKQIYACDRQRQSHRLPGNRLHVLRESIPKREVRL